MSGCMHHRRFFRSPAYETEPRTIAESFVDLSLISLLQCNVRKEELNKS